METDPIESLKSTDGMVDYDENSAVQRHMAESQAAHIRDLTARLGRVLPQFRMVDYGCGPGSSAISVARPAVETYRARFPDDPISVCHADQPGNDWNGLFDIAMGPDGYHPKPGVGPIGAAWKDLVRTEAAVGSFYNQMVADGTVALGTCFAASHWLSHALRLHAPGTVWFADLTGEARAAAAAQARADWVRFLECRARELRQGGFLLVSTLASFPDPEEINGAAASGRTIYRLMQTVAQGMADEGLIDSAILDGFVFGLWFMTAEEAREPLEAEPSLAAAYEIEEVEVRPAPVNPTDVYASARGDRDLYARLYTGYTRAFALAALRHQLFEPSAKDPAEAKRLEEIFFQRFEDHYWAEGEKYASELWILTVVLQRK